MLINNARYGWNQSVRMSVELKKKARIERNKQMVGRYTCVCVCVYIK